MRHYPRNSPQAAARLVALTLVADGHLAPAELEALARLDFGTRLGLDEPAFQAVLQALCEDLLASADLAWSDSVQISPATLQALLAEVDDPVRRRDVTELCLAAVAADAHLADGESRLLEAMRSAWGTDRSEPQRVPAGRPRHSLMEDARHV
jgi:hypothetical protein